MAAKRTVNNLMALAVLATVYQRPMHRYEMATVMKAQGKDRDMDVKWGSLYTVVQSLEKANFLEATGTSRQGARPERTTYRITEAGVAEMVDWTRELLRVPEHEHPRFTAGLSLLSVLAPDTVIELLQQRLVALDASVAAQKVELTEFSAQIPRLFMIEAEYAITMTEAEASWVGSLLGELVNGTFPGLDGWASFHTTGVIPPELAELAERGIEAGHPHETPAGDIRT
jgi:DNA-binding PadR family transcriptional regulator